MDDLRVLFDQMNINTKNSFFEESSFINDWYQHIELFDRFVYKNGGHTGRWSASDHSLFVELRQKHNLNNVIRLLRQKFPDISEKEVIEHNNWYSNYIKFKTKYERAIKFWKLQKYFHNTSSELIKTTIETKPTEQNNSNQAEVKLKIQKWKEKVTAEKKKQKEIEEMREQRRREKEKREKINQKTKIESIRKYKEEMASIQTALSLAENIERQKQKRIAAAKANEMISYFRKKDSVFIEKNQLRKQNHFMKNKAKLERTNSLIEKYKSKIQIDRDPVRVLKPTKEWENKSKKLQSQLTDNSITQFQPFMNIEYIKHLAVPEWRKPQI